jgi:hypothetical protein
MCQGIQMTFGKLRPELPDRPALAKLALCTAKRIRYKKTAAARIRAAAECIEETLTSLTALLNNSLSDCSLLAARGGPSQAGRSRFGFGRPAL